HQLAVCRGRRTPVGGIGQALCLLDEAFLDRAGAVALLVEFGEVRLAPPRVRRPRRREPPPQGVVERLVQARKPLPLLEQVAHAVGATSPVVACGELLRLCRDALLLDASLLDALGALGLALLALLVDRVGE